MRQKFRYYAAQQRSSSYVIHAIRSERGTAWLFKWIPFFHPSPPPFSSPNMGYKCYTLYALLVDALVIVADTSFYKSARAAIISQEHQHERKTHPICPIASSVPTWDSCGTHVLGYSLKCWGIGYGWVPDHRDRRNFGPCLRSHF